MKTVFIIPLTLLMTACTTVPVTIKFPEAPTELIKGCAELQKVPPGTQELSKVLGVVTANYGRYHECASYNEAWIEWYETQKKIYESVK
jgi:hypothetical protein